MSRLSSIVLVLALLLAIGWAARRSASSASRAPERNDPYQQTRDRISLENVPARGPADAPVTIIEYSDYTCVYCRRFFETQEGPLFERYRGKLRLVYKNFPLTGLRSWSEDAALAGACAFRQGNDQFWALHEKLFHEAPRLREGRPLYRALARDAGLDLPAFTTCLDNRAALADVTRDVEEGDRLGVNGTPTFYVNGRPVEGLIPAGRFFQVVDEALAAAR